MNGKALASDASWHDQQDSGPDFPIVRADVAIPAFRSAGIGGKQPCCEPAVRRGQSVQRQHRLQDQRVSDMTSGTTPTSARPMPHRMTPVARSCSGAFTSTRTTDLKFRREPVHRQIKRRFAPGTFIRLDVYLGRRPGNIPHSPIHPFGETMTVQHTARFTAWDTCNDRQDLARLQRARPLPSASVSLPRPYPGGRIFTQKRTSGGPTSWTATSPSLSARRAANSGMARLVLMPRRPQRNRQLHTEAGQSFDERLNVNCYGGVRSSR